MDSQVSSTSREAGPTSREIRQMLSGYMGSKALQSGIELGVFDALADDGPLTSPGLAKRLGLPVSSLQRLLIYLCSRGLLEKCAQGYANSAAADAYLVSDRPTFLVGDAHLGRDLYWLSNFLSDAIRADSNRWSQAFPGRDQNSFAALYRNPTALRGFLAGMAQATRPVAAGLGEVFDFDSARYLLDVGGASAILTTTVLQAYAHLRGSTFDLPIVAPYAQECVDDARLSDRLEVVSGDMFSGALPTGADVITLSWILHDWDDTRAVCLLQHCHAALEPGGAVLLLETLMDDAGTGPAAAAELSLTMLVATDGGRERSAPEYGVLLSKAGFARPEVRRMHNPQDRHCVVGWKE